MTTIRIGNDLPLKWSFFYKDSEGELQPYTLTGRTLQLVMTDPLLKETVIASPTIVSNYLQWTFRGKDQKRIGHYSFTLYENRGANGMHAVDKVCPFALVPVQETTAKGVTQSETSVLSVEPVEFSTEMVVIGSGGNAEWGSITGTLSDQTDLADALDAKADVSDIPTKTSDLANDSGFLTQHQSLAEYRKASAQDVIDATKQDVISDLSTIRSNAASGASKVSCTDETVAGFGFIKNTVNNLANYYLKSETYTQTEVNALISAIKQFTYELVSELPTASASTMGKIYLVPSAQSAAQNVKDEFITIDNGAGATTRYTWEQIGSTSIDLSNYVTIPMLNTALANYTTTANLTTLLAGKQDVISDLATIRSGAALGATALQEHQSLAAYRTSAAQDVIDATKQDKLPNVTNDRYLHTNASTGALEWSEVVVPSDVLKYSVQSLTDGQKAQARTNIGADDTSEYTASEMATLCDTYFG